MPILRSFAASILRDCPANFLKTVLVTDRRFYCREKAAVIVIVLARTDDLDTEEKIALLREFLPSIDGWSLCDLAGTELRMFRNPDLNPDEIRSRFLEELLLSAKPWQVRLAIVIILNHYRGRKEISYVFEHYFSDGVFDAARNNYYVSMALAWCFSVYYITERELTKAYLIDLCNESRIDSLTLSRTVRKIHDSRRLSSSEKADADAFLRISKEGSGTRMLA